MVPREEERERGREGIKRKELEILDSPTILPPPPPPRLLLLLQVKMRSYWNFNLSVLVTFLVTMVSNPDYQELKLTRLCFDLQYDVDNTTNTCDIAFHHDSQFHLQVDNNGPQVANNFQSRLQGCNESNYADFFDNDFGPLGLYSTQTLCCSNFDIATPLIAFTALIFFTLIWSNFYEETFLNFFVVILRLAAFGLYSWTILENQQQSGRDSYCRPNSLVITDATIMFIEVYIFFCLVEIARFIRVLHLNKGIPPRRWLARIGDDLILPLKSSAKSSSKAKDDSGKAKPDSAED